MASILLRPGGASSVIESDAADDIEDDARLVAMRSDMLPGAWPLDERGGPGLTTASFLGDAPGSVWAPGAESPAGGLRHKKIVNRARLGRGGGGGGQGWWCPVLVLSVQK